MKSKNPHTVLVNEILALYENSRILYLWKNNTGVAVYGNRRVPFGKPGSPDIIGLTSKGQFIGIECKTGTARLSPLQHQFRTMVHVFGGTYLIVRSVETVIEYAKSIV